MPIRRQGSCDTSASLFSLPRRRFMQSSALAAAAMALGLPCSSTRTASSAQTVAIIGGGMAGLAAAHELAERGFRVSVYEQRAWGGKARSIPFASTDTGGRLVPSDARNNLSHTLLAAGKHVAYANNATIAPVDAGELPAAIHHWLQDAFFALNIPADELAFFVSKFHVFMTSSDARRLQQWEYMRWWDYVGADTRSANYQQWIGRAPMTEAARSKEASARSVGQALEAAFYARRAGNHQLTDDNWIDTWCRYLERLGVSLNLGVQATQFQYAKGQVTGMLAHANGHARTIQTDWYVLAVPSEKVAALLPPAMKEADNQFAGIAQLPQRWVASVQFLLTQAAQIPQGHFACLHAPWAITGLSQARAASHDHGTVQHVLSLKVSDWTTPGVLYGLPAAQCTTEQIAQELLAQLRHDLPHGHSSLPDSLIHGWVIDPDVTGLGTSHAAHAEPLLIDLAGSWFLRPGTTTAISNFFLAGDYVRGTGAQSASMEAANESGRLAANAILAASGSSAAPATIHARYASPSLTPHFTADAARFAAGSPNAFDQLDPYYPHRHA